jgi:hypothetical protein
MTVTTMMLDNDDVPDADDAKDAVDENVDIYGADGNEMSSTVVEILR